MKYLMTAAALATLIASPAFATQKQPTTYHRTAATDAYAAAPGIAYGSPAVVVDGKVVGADPDANVRLQLRRDADLLNE